MPSLNVDPDSILEFLVRAWSEDRGLKVRRGEAFRADTKNRVVSLPSYFDEPDWAKAMGLKDLARWRIYRFATFHESMHILHSPKDRKKFLDELKSQVGGEKPVKSNLLQALFNVLEDYRVEELGLREYKYREEQTFEKECARKALEGKPLLNRYEALVGHILCDLLLPSTRDVDFSEAIRSIRNLLQNLESEDDLRRSILASYDALYEMWPEDLRIPSNQILLSAGDGTDKVEGKTSDGISDEFKRLTKTIDEFQERLVEEGAVAGEFGAYVQKDLGDWSTIFELGRTQAEALANVLQRWQVGWVEVLSEAGADLDPELFLLDRLGESRRHFIDEELLSPKTDLLVLVDMSGSISQIKQGYLTALAALTHSLDAVGTRFSLLSFSGPALTLIRDKRYPFDRLARERIAGLQPRGGTPLAPILSQLETYLRGFQRLVILTDGLPFNPWLVESKLTQIMRGGLKAGLLVLKRESINYSGQAWLTRVPCVLVSRVSELPREFFKLLPYLS